MKRQKILAITLAAVFCILICVYFFVVAPYIKNNTEVPVETAPETEKGESIGAANRLFLFDAIASKDIARIDVDNEFGGFAFVQNDKGSFVIEGYEEVPYSQDLFYQLGNVTAYTLAKTKVATNPTPEKIEEYGLHAPVANWTVTATDGRSFKVFVGDMLLTGGGYYCMIEGRNSVYVLGQDIATTVITPIESYVTPVLSAGIEQSDYYKVDKFAFYRDGEMMFRIHLVPEEEQVNPDALAENVMDYPTKYYPNSTLYYEIIYKYMGFTADSCYDIYATDEEKKAIGLDEPAYVIAFDYHSTHYEIYFSKKNEDGTYYAASNLYPNVIGIVNEKEVKYLENELIDWIDSYLFQQYITNLSEIKVTENGRDTLFKLTHGFDRDNPDLATLDVQINDRKMTPEQANNFRQYYKSMLAICIEDYYLNDEYCKMTEAEMEEYIADDSNANLIFSYTTLDGEISTYKFFPYSTRHSAVTIDGVGEFYVISDLAQKIINDTERLLNGESVTSNTKD